MLTNQATALERSQNQLQTCCDSSSKRTQALQRTLETQEQLVRPADAKVAEVRWLIAGIQGLDK